MTSEKYFTLTLATITASTLALSLQFHVASMLNHKKEMLSDEDIYNLSPHPDPNGVCCYLSYMDYKALQEKESLEGKLSHLLDVERSLD